jgi:hypothetical protein
VILEDLAPLLLRLADGACRVGFDEDPGAGFQPGDLNSTLAVMAVANGKGPAAPAVPRAWGAAQVAGARAEIPVMINLSALAPGPVGARSR